MPLKSIDFKYVIENKNKLRWNYITHNYKMVIEYLTLFGDGFKNTILYCFFAILTSLIVNPIAAYALSRYQLPSQFKILLFFIATMTFPPMVTMIPNYLLMKDIGFLNTFYALIIPGMANGYSIFLLKGFFDSLPRELYEAADIDAASEFHKFWHIAMSLSKPILAVIALGAFNGAYSNFMFAVVLCPDEKMWTLMVWLVQMQAFFIKRSYDGFFSIICNSHTSGFYLCTKYYIKRNCPTSGEIKMATIKLENIEKCYTKDIPVIKNLDLEINEGEFAVIVGPSGCGKSTLLRLIAGLEEVTNGEIYINNKRVTTTVPKDRDISMVFQNYALYPQMTVYENMAFGLKMRNESSEFIKEKIQWASKKLSLDELLSRKPKELSGGQKQRVALGRAIVREPKVFLFDEPLSNLDAKLRIQMRSVIKRLHEELDATMVYVTHDQVEAMTLGTKIIALNEGVIHQVDSPINLYSDPADTFVGKFIGNPGINLIPVIFLRILKSTLKAKRKNPIISEEIDTKAIFKNHSKKKVILRHSP